VIALVAHSGVDYDLVAQHAPLVLDTCKAMRRYSSDKIVAL
jgi:hypothetical protein